MTHAGVEQRQQTSLVRLHVQFSEVGELTLVDSSNHLYDLTCFMYVVYSRTVVAAGGGPPLGTDRFTMDEALLALRDTRVERIHYSSPLNIMLAISGTIGSAIVAARQAVALFDRVQNSRTHFRQEELRREAIAIMKAELVGREGQTGVNLEQMAQGGASAALNMHTVEIQEETS